MSVVANLSAPTISGAVNAAARRLRQAGVDSPGLDARLLLADILGCGQAELVRDAGNALSDVEWERYRRATQRRAAREPVSRIIGRREFWSLDFELDPHTLDPRADSECLVEAALEILPDRDAPLRILDLGTGTGCLLIALLTEYRAATGVGLDCSAEALRVAARNVARLRVSGRASLLQGDMMSADWHAAVGGGFDLVISNPPYIPEAEIDGLAPEVTRFDPRAALSGGADGLDFYVAITNFLHYMLAPSGWVLLEVGAGQWQAVTDLLYERQLCLHQPRRDLNGTERVVIARAVDGADSGSQKGEKTVGSAVITG